MLLRCRSYGSFSTIAPYSSMLNARIVVDRTIPYEPNARANAAAASSLGHSATAT